MERSELPEPWEGIRDWGAGDTHDGFDDKNGAGGGQTHHCVSGGKKGEYFWKAAGRAGEQGGGRRSVSGRTAPATGVVPPAHEFGPSPSTCPEGKPAEGRGNGSG